MNVDILKSNPPWWWYIVLASIILMLTLSVWITFKITDVCILRVRLFHLLIDILNSWKKFWKHGLQGWCHERKLSITTTRGQDGDLKQG